MSIWDNLDEVESKRANPYIEQIDRGMQLIRQVLSQPVLANELEVAFKDFCRLLEEDYIAFAEKAEMPNEAGINKHIQQFKAQLAEYVSFPELFKKRIVAVGGGFSAGKSTLINSVIKEAVLPTDTTPTTSIPTYILKGQLTTIQTNNIFDNRQLIDDDAVEAMSHAFAKQYQLNLGRVLKHILLESKKMPFANIAILDTPGYSKSDKHMQENSTDEHVARRHLQKAHCLVWVVDIQKGTVPDYDLKFIQSMDFKKPIFFVFNKADKKKREDVTDILRQTKKLLEKEDINFAGIGAISAKLQKEYGRERLSAFLKKQNKQTVNENLVSYFQYMMSTYETYYNNQISSAKIDLLRLNKTAIYSESEQEKGQLKHIIKEKRNRIDTFKQQKQAYANLIQKFDYILEHMQRLLENGREKAGLKEKIYGHRKDALLHYLGEQMFSEPLLKKLKEIISPFSIDKLAEEIEVEEEKWMEAEDLIQQQVEADEQTKKLLIPHQELVYTFTETETVYDSVNVVELIEEQMEELENLLISKAIFLVSDICMEAVQVVREFQLSEDLEASLLLYLKEINQQIIEEIEAIPLAPVVSDELEELVTGEQWVSDDAKPFVEHAARKELERRGREMVGKIDKHYKKWMNDIIEGERGERE